MRKALSYIAGMILAITGIISCSKGGSSGSGNGNGNGGGGGIVDCSTVAKSFSANVNPLIQTFCNQAACHNPGSTNGPGSLTNYTEVFNARTAIRTAIITGTMPQNTTLTIAQKNTITCWIDAGALNN